jgi:DNA-binding transcriptional LysR family regulator
VVRDNARVSVSAGADLSGEVLRITCPEADRDHVFSPLLARFQAQHPNLRLELLVTDRTLDLSKGEADVAVRGGRLRDTRLIRRKIGDVPWRLYAGRAYLEQHGKPESPQQIGAHPVVLYTGGLATLRPMKWLDAVAPKAPVTARADNVLEAMQIVRSGPGLAMLPAFVGAAESALDLAFAPEPELIEPLALLYHPDLRDAPRVRAFEDFLTRETGVLRALLRGERRSD